MASQHHDDIGVACIDGKCKVVGYTEFCRYNLEFIMHVISAITHLSCGYILIFHVAYCFICMLHISMLMFLLYLL